MDRITFTLGLLILAGGFGNLYDRALNDGRVVDFMHFQLGPLETGVFNVADVAIMIGMFGFIFISTNWGRKII
jgi:signal peptidase II